MEHPFIIFTEFPWVWGPLYGTCLLIGSALFLAGNPFGLLLIIGVIGSAVVISFWSILFWALTE